ncbi:MAG TPA: hypothetical protein VF603_04430 [Allosphingosinicella sp.]
MNVHSNFEQQAVVPIIEHRLEEMHAADRRLEAVEKTANLLLGFLVLFYGISISDHLGLSFVTSAASDERIKIAGGVIALLCIAFIALTFRRRRRDMVRNDIRDLRLQLAWMNAREEARSRGGDPNQGDR